MRELRYLFLSPGRSGRRGFLCLVDRLFWVPWKLLFGYTNETPNCVRVPSNKQEDTRLDYSSAHKRRRRLTVAWTYTWSLLQPGVLAVPTVLQVRERSANAQVFVTHAACSSPEVPTRAIALSRSPPRTCCPVLMCSGADGDACATRHGQEST